ncbi:MAG: DMT family transporter [bacterium]|jgi:drug/metabolite transporter (DMT)-like permease|nr:DMT family transporter [Betaproteobacteria bacterium]
MNRRAGLLALFAGAFCIASSAIWVRLSELGPVATAFWRVALALPLLWAWASAMSLAAHAQAGRRFRWPLAAAGACFAGDLALWHGSIVLTSVANATLLANFAPIFVTLAVWLVYSRRPSTRFVVALAVALAGTVVLVGASMGSAAGAPSSGRMPAADGSMRLVGDALGIGTAMFYAAYQLFVSRVRGSVSTASVMAWSSLACAAILLPIAVASGEALLPSTLHGWAILAGLALTSHVAGQSLIAYAIAHLTPTLASVGLLLQPVVAAAFAWLVLGERVGALQVAGGTIVLMGIWLATRADRPVRD